MKQFVHLHNHSHYSLLDGACRTEDLVHGALNHGMPAVALTDHGVMFGALEFYKKATKAEVKPIIGVEAYIVTRGGRKDRERQEGLNGTRRASYHHLLLLAKDVEGYRNLIRLCSDSHIEGFYYKPRIDLEILQSHRRGLVATTACSGGVVGSQLVEGNEEGAYQTAGVFKEIFGEDFYIEIQNHGLEREEIIRRTAPSLARRLGLKLVATNDVHYLKREHALAHNIMLLIPDASSTSTPDYNQLRYQTDQLYFKSTEEMIEAFRDFPDAITTTLEIAEKCSVKLDLHVHHMPRFPIPDDSGAAGLDEYLEQIAWKGFRRRYPDAGEDLASRMAHELAVIKRMGYAGYFLIVQDFISAARDMGVPVGPGRGSAAGSVVSYALGITNVDPIRFGLLFERFLNPDRVSMPDIDVDFSDKGRDKVIEYVRSKYGTDSVSQIITFGTLSSRAVLKDVGRVLGIPLSTVESITKLIPQEQGKVRPLNDALESVPELKWVKESTDPKIRMLVEVSLVLEGLNRGAGMHAAGVVIAPGDISEYVPVYKTPQTEVMTQYNMKDLELAGLLKMDFLGLRTLSVLEEAHRLIRENHGVSLDLESIPFDDAPTFELFARADTVGVFQFESSGMQDWLTKLKPTTLTDLVAMNALYRPGPMEMIGQFIARKHGQQAISYLHPALEPILRETYGVIVYQEQVMQIVQEIAGFSLARADVMRRAMGKKDKASMAQTKEEFVSGAAGRGCAKKLAAEIFDLIEKFASYGFNKSHSVAYSVLAFQTAYLKAHFRAEFMAANLTSEIGDTDRITRLIEDCRKGGIRVLPPDVNLSNSDFMARNGEIRFGLVAIKNVGEAAIRNVVDERSNGGPYGSLYDFCARVDLHLVNKKCIESLVQAGAFDTLEPERSRLFHVVERACAYGQSVKDQRSRGQDGLFDAGGPSHQTLAVPPLPEAPRWPELEKLAREKAVLGFYVSGHPLLRYEQEVNEFANVHFGDVQGFRDGTAVRACGIVTTVKRKQDKRNNTMAFVGFEDFSGKAECIVFSDAFAKYGSLLVPDAMVMVTGKGEVNGEILKIIVADVYRMEDVRAKFAKSIVLQIDLDAVQTSTVERLKQILERHKGNCPCYFTVYQRASRKIYSTRRYSVDPSESFLQETRGVLGPQGVRFSG